MLWRDSRPEPGRLGWKSEVDPAVQQQRKHHAERKRGQGARDPLPRRHPDASHQAAPHTPALKGMRRFPPAVYLQRVCLGAPMRVGRGERKLNM